MFTQKIVVLFVVLGIAGAPSFAAIGSEGDSGVVREASAIEATTDEGQPSATQEAARLREAGEKVCREAVDTAAVLGQQFMALTQEVPRLMSQIGEQVARDIGPAMQKFGEEMAPVMREFAERLRQAAQELERPDTSGSTDGQP